MASKYYDSDGKEVFDGDVVYAADLNTINTSVDTAFQGVVSDLDGALDDLDTQVALAKAWAVGPGEPPEEGDEVEAGYYSSKYYSTVTATFASTAEGWAIASSGFADNSEASSLEAEGQAIIATDQATLATAEVERAKYYANQTDYTVVFTYANLMRGGW